MKPKRSLFTWKRKRHFKRLLLIVFSVLIGVWWFSIPKPLFPNNYSQVVFSREGKLMGARIATDEQWRFPASDSVPFKFKKCILLFEDEYFYQHPGVNPFSLMRAMVKNIQNGKVTSGASTLSMQTIRLSGQNPERSYWEKIKEIVKATRLEATYSKDSILNLYAAHAPFGGNVVGLEAAAWRYYGKLPHQLSWGESATLAVLPNAPALIFPGKNQSLLLNKRNRLLKKLNENNVLNTEDYLLAISEPLPQKPYALPQLATHFIDFSAQKFPHSRVKSTLDYALQNKVNSIVSQHHFSLSQREIQNIAVIVSSVDTGEVLAYVGNSDEPNQAHQNAVDINQAVRSSGSILKPILFASMLDSGELLPNMLVRDIPSDITENFSQQYQGRVEASKALIQSLNIPAIGMLKKYGVSRFHSVLKQLGFNSLQQPSSHYGLSLIVGGAEISPWDLNKAYRNLAVKLKNEKPLFLKELQINSDQKPKNGDEPQLSNEAIFQTFKTLTEVVRPQHEMGWRVFGDKNIAWKTGTSHGYKDAWSVGITPDYIITVWVGNADGEGRPGIIGVQAAAPILFDIYHSLPTSTWFEKPPQFQVIRTCSISGYPKGEFCPTSSRIEIPQGGLKIEKCPFHQNYWTDAAGNYRVSANCYPMQQAKQKVYFVLPVVEEKYFQKIHPWYESLPNFKEECKVKEDNVMDFVYPRNFTQMYLPKNENGNIQPMVVRVSHKDKDAIITWMLDEQYLTQTSNLHECPIKASYGKHRLVLMDNQGRHIQKSFEVKSK